MPSLKGRKPGRPATHWDKARTKPPKAADRQDEEPKDGAIDEEEYEDGELYCTVCESNDHMWQDCPENEGDGESSDLSAPLHVLEKNLEADGYKVPPSVEPFDAENPDMRACFSTPRLSKIPIMLSGPKSLFEVEQAGTLPYWLWTSTEVKQLSELEF